jgi:hypothetical protein
MKRAKVGLVILTLWGSLNILVAAAVTIMTLAKESPPALRLVMSGDAIRRIDPLALAVINAQAAFANPCIIGFCVLVLTMLWSNRHAPKGASHVSHYVLIPTLLFVQIFAFVSDGYLGHKNLPANLVSTFLLTVGLTLVLTSSVPHRTP